MSSKSKRKQLEEEIIDVESVVENLSRKSDFSSDIMDSGETSKSRAQIISITLN